MIELIVSEKPYLLGNLKKDFCHQLLYKGLYISTFFSHIDNM